MICHFRVLVGEYSTASKVQNDVEGRQTNVNISFLIEMNVVISINVGGSFNNLFSFHI